MNMKLIHGEGEIKVLDTKIKNILKVLGGKTFKALPYNNKLSDDISAEYGLLTKKGSGYTFLDKRQVIKVCYVTRRPPDIKYRVPTLIYCDNDLKGREWNDCWVVMIQPLIKPLEMEDYPKAKLEFKSIKKTTDIHIGNIGIYKNKYKLFDW